MKAHISQNIGFNVFTRGYIWILSAGYMEVANLSLTPNASLVRGAVHISFTSNGQPALECRSKTSSLGLSRSKQLVPP
ncbi:hypothetical protein ABKN59_004409 [Abortiporus biennis]